MHDEHQIPQADQQAQKQKEELAAYEKLRQHITEILAATRDNVNAQTIGQAVDTAVAKLKSAGDFTAEASNKAVVAMRRDIASVTQRLGPKWEQFSDKSAGVFSVWRDRGAGFLGQAASAAGAWLESAGEKLKHPTYAAGEMYAGGAIACQSCGARVDLPGPGHVPPCPKCTGTSFARV